MIPVVIVVVAAAVAAVVTTAAIVTVVATVATVMMTNSMVIVMIGIIRKQKWVHLLQEVRRKIGSDNCHLGLLLTLLFYDVVIRLPNMFNTWKTNMVLGFRTTIGNKLEKSMKETVPESQWDKQRRFRRLTEELSRRKAAGRDL